MSIAYAQKNKNAVQTKRESFVSIIDTSSQNKSLQRKADMANSAAQRAEAPRPNNTGMPDNLKAGIESLSGFSMDDVRVHYNSSKPATVQALAYTQGTDIHVAPGQEKCLPHEAWHVAQQMAGRVSPTTNINGMPVNDNAALEHEADVMGEKAVGQMKMAHSNKNYVYKSLKNVSQLLSVNEINYTTEYTYKNLVDALQTTGDSLTDDSSFKIGKEAKKKSDWKKIFTGILNVTDDSLGVGTYGKVDISECTDYRSIVKKLKDSVSLTGEEKKENDNDSSEVEIEPFDLYTLPSESDASKQEKEANDEKKVNEKKERLYEIILESLCHNSIDSLNKIKKIIEQCETSIGEQYDGIIDNIQKGKSLRDLEIMSRYVAPMNEQKKLYVEKYNQLKEELASDDFKENFNNMLSAKITDVFADGEFKEMFKCEPEEGNVKSRLGFETREILEKFNINYSGLRIRYESFTLKGGFSRQDIPTPLLANNIPESGTDERPSRDHIVPFENIGQFIEFLYEKWDFYKDKAMNWIYTAYETYLKNNRDCKEDFVRALLLLQDNSKEVLNDPCIRASLMWMPGNIVLSWIKSKSGVTSDRVADSHKGKMIDSYTKKIIGCGAYETHAKVHKIMCQIIGDNGYLIDEKAHFEFLFNTILKKKSVVNKSLEDGENFEVENDCLDCIVDLIHEKMEGHKEAIYYNNLSLAEKKLNEAINLLKEENKRTIWGQFCESIKGAHDYFNKAIADGLFTPSVESYDVSKLFTGLTTIAGSRLNVTYPKDWKPVTYEDKDMKKKDLSVYRPKSSTSGITRCTLL